MKYRGIIFDLDGVICHTDKYHYQAWKQVADQLGIYFDETINNRLRGVSRMESFEIILERYDGAMSEEEKERYTAEKNEIYKELLKNMSPADLAPEVKATMDELRKLPERPGRAPVPLSPASSWDSWDLTVTSTPFRTAIRSPIPNRTRKSFCWPRS